MIGQPGVPRASTRWVSEPRWALVVGVSCVAVTVVLGAHYWRGTRGGWTDELLGGPVRAALAGWHPLLWAVVWWGAPGVLGGVCLLVAVVALRRRHWDIAAVIVVAPALASVITEWLLKPLVGRTIAVGWCYPSGHMTGVTAAAVTVFLASRARGGSTRGRVVWAAVAMAVPLAMAVSLVGLGVHYLTDTVGGGCVALAATLLVAVVRDVCVVPACRAGVRFPPDSPR